jgi:soluble lytic murein transglycosylase-like protein
MEKRPKKTHTRTLGCGQATAKLALTLILFFPPLSAFNKIEPHEKAGVDELISNGVELVDRIRPKELAKINAILRSHRPDMSDSESWRLSEVIFEESAKRQLDPLIVTALIQVESGFKSAVVSPMGARGMMQIMPDTGKFLAEAVAGEYGFQLAAFRPESLDDPVFNLRLGIYYLHDLKKQFQHLTLALTAYNLGPAGTQNRLENNLDLSDEFASLVLDAYQRHKKIRQPTF